MDRSYTTQCHLGIYTSHSVTWAIYISHSVTWAIYTSQGHLSHLNITQCHLGHLYTTQCHLGRFNVTMCNLGLLLRHKVSLYSYVITHSLPSRHFLYVPYVPRITARLLKIGLNFYSTMIILFYFWSETGQFLLEMRPWNSSLHYTHTHTHTHTHMCSNTDS
jgi:hypothetical protein